MTTPDEDSTGGGSGEGGTLGTPSLDTKEEPPGSDEDGMVVSGGGVADTGGEDSAAGAGDRGLG